MTRYYLIGLVFGLMLGLFIWEITAIVSDVDTYTRQDIVAQP
jgi:hypothetical protein